MSLSRRGWERQDRVPVDDSGHMSSGRPSSAGYAETDGPLVPQRANTLADCRDTQMPDIIERPAFPDCASIMSS